MAPDKLHEIEIPAGLETKLSDLIDQLAEKEIRAKRNTHISWISGIAASVAILCSIGFLYKTKSTFDTPIANNHIVIEDPEIENNHIVIENPEIASNHIVIENSEIENNHIVIENPEIASNHIVIEDPEIENNHIVIENPEIASNHIVIEDPEIACQEIEKALLKVSANFNKGIDQLSANLKKIRQNNNTIKS